MLNADIDTFLDIPVPYPLIDDHPHRALCDIVDDASLAMVDFVWHSMLL